MKKILTIISILACLHGYGASGPLPYITNFIGGDNTLNTQASMGTYVLGSWTDAGCGTDCLIFEFENNLEFYEAFGEYVSHEWFVNGSLATPSVNGLGLLLFGNQLGVGFHEIKIIVNCGANCTRSFYYNFTITSSSGRISQDIGASAKDPRQSPSESGSSWFDENILQVTDLSGNVIWQAGSQQQLDYGILEKNRIYIQVVDKKGQIVRKQFIVDQ